MGSEKATTCLGGRERNSRWPRRGASNFTARRENSHPKGVDEMTVGELRLYLKVQWPKIKAELLEGRYRPQPVRRVEIPKRTGGMRQLGIPTVVDRLIQQALHQVLSPLFDPGFSESSYGFRPGRSAHGAVKAARRYVRGGPRCAVDVDV